MLPRVCAVRGGGAGGAAAVGVVRSGAPTARQWQKMRESIWQGRFGRELKAIRVGVPANAMVAQQSEPRAAELAVVQVDARRAAQVAERVGDAAVAGVDATIDAATSVQRAAAGALRAAKDLRTDDPRRAAEWAWRHARGVAGGVVESYCGATSAVVASVELRAADLLDEAEPEDVVGSLLDEYH